MSTVQEIESAIAKLSEAELVEIRGWLWDRDIERDAAGGRLEEMADEAIREHRAGKTKRL
jgi:hypothetical protein